MNLETQLRVKAHIEAAMERLVHRRVVQEPFLESDIEQNNPFGYRLVPLEVWQGAKFERSFVTTLGQGIFEQIGKIIAEGTGAYAENQQVTKLRINTFRVERIEAIIKNQRSARQARGETIATPELSEELNELQHKHLDNERYEDMNILSDLYVRRTDGQEEFYSFKTVKPNLDQTAEAKKNLLILRCAIINCEAYFAFPHNPAGEGNPYKNAGHTIPCKLFNMDDSKYVLLGSSLWNKIGNDQNTFSQLLKIFEDVGENYKGRIKADYFGKC